MDIQMTITVSTETAAKVIELLNKAGGANPASIQTTPLQQPMQYSAPVQPNATIQAVSAPQTAPTATPIYTIGQLQTAIAPLLDAGKVTQIQQLVQSFGVNTLMDIPQERYGEFANGLRALGGVL